MTSDAPRSTLDYDNIKPCPFCGCTHVTIYEGSTYRWYGLECVECGGRCGEIRRPTLGEGGIDAEALEKEWNTRVP